MSQKLGRAKHTHGRHAGIDKTLARHSADPGKTSQIPIIGSHAGLDRTNPDGVYEAPLEELEAIEAVQAMDDREVATASKTPKGNKNTCVRDDATDTNNGEALAKKAKTAEPGSDEAVGASNEAVGASAALMSVCVIISRITGFGRTWAMAFALGSTFLASTYQVANNLPNMLYELVLGGMLATAFLPVYMSIKKQEGIKRGNDYASNLLSLIIIILSIATVICIIFATQIIYTQSFFSNQEAMSVSVYFFQFFAVQMLFYGCAAIVSGLLNANREYFWPAIAPVFNNVVVIISFVLYAVIAPRNQAVALLIIAVGNSLGVFVQMAIQIPALARKGVRVRLHIDFHDPSLRETIRLGAPAILVTICELVTVSVTNAAAYAFADNGPSIIYYARLWFTLPYSFLVVPITTALFTELADMHADNNITALVNTVLKGARQVLFIMVPFALYLIVFSTPLITLYNVGAFTREAVNQISFYLATLALALPFYSLNTFLQKVFSSIRRMGIYSLLNIIAVCVQVAITAFSAWSALHGSGLLINWIAIGTLTGYALGDIIQLSYLSTHFRRHHTKLYGGKLIVSFLKALALGAAGAAVGYGVYTLLVQVFGPVSYSVVKALVFVVIAGSCGLAVTFIPAIKLRLPEAAFITGLFDKIVRRFKKR